MLINTTSKQQQDHREMASSDAEIDIKVSRVYFMMWSFSSYQKDEVVSISLCPSNLYNGMWLQLNIMKNKKNFFFWNLEESFVYLMLDCYKILKLNKELVTMAVDKRKKLFVADFLTKSRPLKLSVEWMGQS